MWQGPLVGLNNTAVKCKATKESPGVRPPHPNQTWCLDAPNPSWDGIEKEGSWFPLLFPSLGS